jgi:hypothetical protein
MAVVISNRGRLISDLTSVSNLNNNDLFIIQSVNADSNSTRKATITQLSNKVLGSLTSYATTVKFSSTGNEFTGSFYNANGNTSNLYDLTIRNTLSIGAGVTATISPTSLTFAPVNGALFTKKITNTIGGITGSASTGFTGSLKGKLTGPVTGNVTGNVVGTLTGNVAGNVTGNVAGNVVGSVTGNVTGDIYSPTSNLVLDNGTGVPKSARFYGTSSFATWAENVIGGGSGISAAQAKSYVTTSMNSGGGVANTLPKFSGTSKLGLSSIVDDGTLVTISTALQVNQKISSTSITGSFYGGPGGYKIQGTKSVSFWGTGSHAVSASYLKSDSPNPLGILTQTSPLTVNSYKGSKYEYTHLLGSTPYYFRSVLICVTNDTTAGYIVDDEVEAVAVIYDSGGADDEFTAITSWSNSTYVGASFLNTAWLINKKSDGSAVTIDPSFWKIKFYYK